MSIKSSLLPFCAAVAILAGSALAATPVLVSESSALQVKSARVVNASNGAYVTGTTQTSFGYSAPSNPHVHVLAYDARGNLIGEAVDNVNRTRLMRSHLNPRARSSYVAFFPASASQIAKIYVVSHSGHSHS